MTLQSGKRRKYWTCPRCKWRNEHRTSSRKCQNPACGEQSKPRRNGGKRKPQESYAVFCQVNETIHGVTDESCGVCGKPRSEYRKHDRDHDHNTGLPRGLACPGDNGCNVLMAKWISAGVALAIAMQKQRDGEPDAERWAMIAAYLGRVEAHYAA